VHRDEVVGVGLGLRAGCTIWIASDGEVLVQGHIVFQGYWASSTC